jgi:PAS domain S-box-containing protein
MPIPAKPNRWFNSLLARLTILTLGIVVLLGGASSIYVNQQELDLAHGVENEGAALAQDLSTSASALLAHQDVTALQQAVNRVTVSEELMDLAIVDQQGAVVAKKEIFHRTNQDGSDAQVPIGQIWSADVLSGEKSGVQQILRVKDSSTIIQPIFRRDASGQPVGKAIGAVLVRMSMHELALQQGLEAAKRSRFIPILIVVIGGVFVPLIYLWVIRPLNQITAFTAAVATGKFQERLSLKGAREITALTAAFNRMAEDLQVSQKNTQDHLDEMQILHEISVATSHNFDLNQILEELTGRLAKLMEADTCVISLWEDKTLLPRVRSAYGLDGNDENHQAFMVAEHLMLTMISEVSHPIFIGPGIELTEPSPPFPIPAPYQCLLGLPLIVNDTTIGAVLIADTHAPRAISMHQMKVAMSAVGQIAATISNTSLFLQLDSERKRLDAILDAVSDAILVTDMHGMTLYVNPAFTALTGQNLETTQQSPPWSFIAIPDDQLSSLRTEIRTSLTQGSSWRRELTVKHPDGMVYDIDMAVSSIRDRDNQLVGFVGSLRDITELKELDRMKNRFVSTVSHELRTPLSVINLYTENLLEFYSQLDDTQRRELLTDIHTETRTLHQLIEDLLSLSRLDSGRAEPRRKEFDLNELLVESIISARRLADEKHLDLTYYLPERAAQVFADSDQLAQVFRNLLSNAVKFTPQEGRVQVDVEIKDQQVIVRIADTGIGIPPTDMPRLFERFYRSEISVQQEIPGTGLGLAISREIIQRHQGAITVQSEVGLGSTFSVILPLARANHPTIILINDSPQTPE